MAFIVPGVARFTVHQSIESIEVANVLDMRIDTTGATVDRAEAIFDQAGILINQWDADVLPLLVDDLSLTSVSWVDLDDPDGTTGERSSTDTVTLPQTGTQVDPPLPSGVSFLIKKTLEGSSRARRTGRIYVTGVANSYPDPSDGNVITAAFVPDVQDAFNDFLGNINQNGGGVLAYQSALCVVHVLTRGPAPAFSPLTGDSTDVADLVADARFAFQRRRSGR